MSKSVVLVLESSYEQDYGEYANIPVFNAHGEIIGWTGGDVPEYGHPCEFNALNEEGFTLCASSATVNRLRAENAKLRELVRDMHGELVSCEDNGYVCGGHKFDKRVRELRIEADE